MGVSFTFKCIEYFVAVVFFALVCASCNSLNNGNYQAGYQGQGTSAVCPSNPYSNNIPLPPDIAADPYASRGYCVTSTNCDFRVNPHTYACTTATFGGGIFPFYEINNSTWQAWQANWVIVTYVNPTGHRGNEFYMKQNPNNPRQPLLVYNVANDSPMGLMWIDQNRNLVIENWNGNRNMVFVWESQYRQDNNIRWVARTRYGTHALTCRDFNRNDKHHLLCAWDVEAGYGGWNHKGYFGFLLQRDWAEFRPDGR